MTRPLGTAKELIENAGYSITYIHEDIVFVNTSYFLLRFDDADKTNLFLHFNVECENSVVSLITDKLTIKAGQMKVQLRRSVNFQMDPSGEKNMLNIEFLIA